MPHTVTLKVSPSERSDDLVLKTKSARKLGLRPDQISSIIVRRRSLDARKRPVLYNLRLEVFTRGEASPVQGKVSIQSLRQGDHPQVVIVGAGPAGYYAALECLKQGVRPIVIERGKDVQARRRDLRLVQQEHTVPVDSNYCFGEGGAGTYSDGKLYTRAKKRGNIEEILRILVDHGANPDILIDAHPHIGSNKLPKIIAAIRTTIEENGGIVKFNARVVDFLIQDRSIVGVTLANGEDVSGEAFILATGHSARDIYDLCEKHRVGLRFKPFAMGVRIEHPQEIIDEIQYGQRPRSQYLPAASYRLACQSDDRGVFSFCMCPGGLIIPAATAPGEIVVNGMSLSRRDSPYANSGLVVSMDQNPNPDDEFGGLRYQKNLEQQIFNHGDGSLKAPAQRITDFANGKVSSTLPSTSYIPGIYAAPLHEFLPDWMTKAIKVALHQFDKSLKGYYTQEAQLVGLESRTSSPIWIDRDADTLMSPSLQGLFPCGEGAGYAGGIVSAALDGQRVARKVKSLLSSKA